MKDMRKLAMAVICIGFASLLMGVVSIYLKYAIAGISPHGYAMFTGICLLLSINLLLLDRKS